jgi:UDP:flavonoid glycosyltransferase YjiC (YdhE family)
MARRVLITSWGSFGDVYPYVGLGLALARRGDQVALAVPTLYREIVEREGLEFCQVGPEIDPGDRATIARVMDPATGPRAIICDLLMPALRPTYAALESAARGADMIVSHPITFAAPLLAAKRDLPWASTVLAPLSFFSVTDFPVLPNAPDMARLYRLGPSFTRLLGRIGRRATRSWTKPVDQLRADLGLPRVGDPLFEGQFSPALTLAMFSRVLAAPQDDWPPHVETTGFMFYNGRDQLSDDVERFLADGEPPVVFTLGSSAVGAAGRFYQESAAAIAQMGLRAILLTGGFPENEPPGGRSENILIASHSPHQLLFPRARAIVHQCGIGTTGQALRSGRPALVVPHAHDQPDNAFRVTRLGVARTLFPARYTASRVARELRALFDDPAYERRAEEVAGQVRAEGGAEAGADALGRITRGVGDVRPAI